MVGGNWITDVRNRNGYDVNRRIIDYSDHPGKLVTLNPNSNQPGAGRYQLSRWWDAYRKQLGLERLLSESQDAVALQQIKERGALPD